MTEHGGTVRYHRAELNPDGNMWRVWFTEDAAYPIGFPVAEGEAMGLTPPEPEPLVVTCNGHSIELSGEQVRELERAWAEGVRPRGTSGRRADNAVIGLLRDARQEPQPASGWVDVSDVDDDPNDLIPALHDAAVARPEQDDTPSDTLDFDAMPIGTVLRHKDGGQRIKIGPELWWFGEDDEPTPQGWLAPANYYTVVHQPAPVSRYEGLRAVLAGRDDADELADRLDRIASALDHGLDPLVAAEELRAVGDAARSGGAK